MLDLLVELECMKQRLRLRLFRAFGANDYLALAALLAFIAASGTVTTAAAATSETVPIGAVAIMPLILAFLCFATVFLVPLGFMFLS